MKKTYFMKFSFLILTLILIGCSKETKIPVGIYIMNESTEHMKPTVLLEEDNKFVFNYSVFSSYYATGSYEKNKDRLILKTDDGNFKYVFEIYDYTLIFNDSESSEMPSFANVPGGALFRLNQDKSNEKEPFIGIGYNLEYKDKIFPNMTDLEIAEIIDRITIAATKKAKKGETFEITEEELETLNIKGLDTKYLNMIKISTE